MLEKVREAAASARLQAKANLVIDAHGHHGCCAIRGSHHAQAVSKLGMLDGNMKFLGRWIQRLPPRGFFLSYRLRTGSSETPRRHM